MIHCSVIEKIKLTIFILYMGSHERVSQDQTKYYEIYMKEVT